MALSDAERAARYRERRKVSEKPVVVRYRPAADRRGKAKQWDDAVDTLLAILDAQDVAAGPVARIHLPVKVPFGFHGLWIPEEDV